MSAKDTIWVRRLPAAIGAAYRDSLVPLDDRSAERIAKVPLGAIAEIRIVRPRSSPQNNLYWAVLHRVVEATEWESAGTLHEVLKVRLGYFTTGKTPMGKLVAIPHSAAFDAMTHEEFCEYMDKALDTICVEILGGYDKDQLIEEVKAMMGQSRIGHNGGPALALAAREGRTG